MTTNEGEKKPLPSDAVADWLFDHGISEDDIYLEAEHIKSSTPQDTLFVAAGRLGYMAALWNSGNPEDLQKLGKQICWLAKNIQDVRSDIDPDAPPHKEARADITRMIGHQVAGPNWLIGAPLPSEGQE